MFMKIKLLQFLKIHLILAENNTLLQKSSVLNGTEICRDDLPVCFLKTLEV